MPEVSVIIPTHNRSGLLCRAVSSALGQTFSDLEIIIVDDASEDNTQAIIETFADVRIRYIRHPTKHGVAGARNTGVVNAVGPYIAFLDDDDEWLPEKIARQTTLLKESPKAVGVVYTGWLAVEAESGRLLNRYAPSARGDIFDFLLAQDSLAPTSTLLLRKECFERAGLFDVQFEYGEDFDLWVRIARLYHFEPIAEPLVRYSVPNDSRLSLSSNYRARIKASEAQLEKYATFFASDRKRLSRRYFDLGVLHCYARDTGEGRRALWKAIRTYPLDAKYYFNMALALFGPENFKRLKKLKERDIPPRGLCGGRI